ALDSDNAEALPARRAHYHPALHPLVDCRAESFEARHLFFDVVGFDVDVDSALVIDTLNLDADLVRAILEHDIIAARARVIRIYGTTERLCPAARRRTAVVDLAGDQAAVATPARRRSPR